MKVPTQIILIFMLSGSISTEISCPIGISAGNSNQTRFRFWSGVPPTYPYLMVNCNLHRTLVNYYSHFYNNRHIWCHFHYVNASVLRWGDAYITRIGSPGRVGHKFIKNLTKKVFNYVAYGRVYYNFIHKLTSFPPCMTCRDPQHPREHRWSLKVLFTISGGFTFAYLCPPGLEPWTLTSEQKLRCGFAHKHPLLRTMARRMSL